MSEPTASELIAFFRGKAQEYERLAKSIEQATNAWPGTVNIALKATANSAIPPTVENIRKSIRDKGARIADLAQRFGTAESVIREIVSNPENGIRIDLRGWLKVDQPQPLTLYKKRTEDFNPLEKT